MAAEEKPPYVRLDASNTAPITRVAFDLGMAEVWEYRPTTLVDIAADGDVILVVGPEKIRLRVHCSLVANRMRAHPIFSAPDWFRVRAPVR